MNSFSPSAANEDISIEHNLQRYLETETLLNDFFNAFDYCTKKCINVEIENNGGRPVSGCCKDRYYCISDLDHPTFSLLIREREIRYGTPEHQATPDPVSPCEYHSPRGCRLTTHKSPICLSFMCRKSIDTLRKTYSIYTYDYLGMYYALEWILTGDFSDESYRQFTKSIIDMTRQVKRQAES